MASDNEASCINDPNFAVICGFLEKFGVLCGVTGPDFMELQEMLENTQEVPPALIDLHIKLLRKVRRSVSRDRWERVLIKVCHIYCTQDAWELERFGYKKARLTSKLRILKNLCEMQFDLNQKFKAEVNRQTAPELRSEPIGRDKFGHTYWYQIDENCQLRVYREDPDEETWSLVARDREGLVRLIQQLSDGDVGELVLNEDSNSLEIEKPITDTGQISSSVSTCEAEADVDADADADVDADVDADADADELSTGNEDSKESVASEVKTDAASSNESDNKITQPEAEPEHVLKENDLKITINKNNIIPVKNVETDKMENNKNISTTTTISSNFRGTDVLSKKKKSINELAENLTKHKITDLPIKPIIQELHHFPQQQQQQQQQQQHQQHLQHQHQQQEQEMDLSMKKPVIKVKHFASLSEPPIDFEKSDDEDDEDDDDDSYESDEIKLPSHMKQPRLGRPTLLGNAKKKTYSDEEDEDDDEDDEYGEPIEEPVMLIQGEGSGRECKNENTNLLDVEFSDVIEESVIYFYGEGSGRECNTGNTAKEEDKSTSPEKKDETCKGSSLTPEGQSSRTLHCGSELESAVDDSKSHKIGTVMIDVKPVDRTQVIPDVVQLKKNSRWDVGKPNECAPIGKQPSTNISIKNERNIEDKLLDVKSDSETNDTSATNSKDMHLPQPTSVPPKQPKFFFGPQADCFKFSSPISTHFQCTKSPSNISNTDIKDEKPGNASVKKSENVPIIEKKSEILLAKEHTFLTEISTENILDKKQNETTTQLESIDSAENNKSLTPPKTESSKDQLLNLEKEHETTRTDVEQNATKTSKDLAIAINVKEQVPNQIGLVNKKLDDDIADDKSETLSETLDSLETLIENDDTAIDKEKSQLPKLECNSSAYAEGDNKPNNKEVVVDTKPCISEDSQNITAKQIAETAKSVDTTEVDEAIRPLDKTQIDEISSSNNYKGDDDKGKCEIYTAEKMMVPNIDKTVSLQQVKSSQVTELISLEKSDPEAQQKPTDAPPSEEKPTKEIILEPTTSKTIPLAENKSTLKDTLITAESTKTVDSSSSLQSVSKPNIMKTPDMLPEPTVVQSKINLDKTSGNENLLSSSSDRRHLDEKSPVDINKEEDEEDNLKTPEDVSLKKSEDDSIINTELTKKSNETTSIVQVNVEKVSDHLQAPIINITQSASENTKDNILTNNKLSASDKMMEENAIENSTKITNDNLKTDKSSVNINNDTEQTLQMSQISSEDNDSKKSKVIIETNYENIVNNLVEKIPEKDNIIKISEENADVKLIEKISEKDTVITDNDLNLPESVPKNVLEHTSVASKTESSETLNKSEIVLENTSKHNLDKSNNENRSDTEIIIDDKATSAISEKTKFGTTHEIENISGDNSDAKSIETRSDNSSSCEIKSPVKQILKLDSTTKIIERTSQAHIDKTKQTSENISEQISVLESFENKVEMKTADSNVNLLGKDLKQRNLVVTSKENQSESVNKNAALTNLAVDCKSAIVIENLANDLKNDPEINMGLKTEEKNVSVQITSKHEKNDEKKDDSNKIIVKHEKSNDDEENLKSMSSKNDDKKDTEASDLIINTDKDNKIDDSRRVIEETSLFQKEKLANKKQLKIETKISTKQSIIESKSSIKQPEFSTDTSTPMSIEEENKSKSHDITALIKDNLPQKNEDLSLKDNSKNEGIGKSNVQESRSDVSNIAQISEVSTAEIDKYNVQEIRSPEIPGSAQIPENRTEKDAPLVTEVSIIKGTADKKITETTENKEYVCDSKISVKILDDLKPKDSSKVSLESKLDVENIPKEKNISFEAAKRNQVESHNSELICNVQPVEINKKNILDSLEKNIETQDNKIELSDVPIEKPLEKNIPQNVTSSNVDTVKRIDSSLQSVEETSNLLKTQDYNDKNSNIKEKVEHFKDKTIAPEIVSKLESNKDINLKTTSICLKETANLKVTKDEQVYSKINKMENIPKSSLIKNKEKSTDENEQIVSSDSIVADCESVVIPKTDLSKTIVTSEEIMATEVAVINPEENAKKDEKTKVVPVISTIVDPETSAKIVEQAEVTSTIISTIDSKTSSKKDDEKAITPIVVSKNDPEKEKVEKEIPVAASVVDSEKSLKISEKAKLTPIAVSTISPRKDEAVKEIFVAASTIDPKNDEKAKITSVAKSTIDVKKDDGPKETRIATIDPKKDEKAKVTPIAESTIDSIKDEAKIINVVSAKESKKDKVAKETPVDTIGPTKDEKVKVTPIAQSTKDSFKDETKVINVVSKKDKAAKETPVAKIDPKKDEKAKITPIAESTKDTIKDETKVINVVSTKESKKDKAAKEISVATIDLKKDEKAKVTSIVESKIDSIKNEAKVITVLSTKESKKDKAANETSVATIDPKKDEKSKVTSIVESKIDSIKDEAKVITVVSTKDLKKDKAAKETPVITIDSKKDEKAEATLVAVSTKDPKKDEASKEISVAVSTMNPKKDDTVKEIPVAKEAIVTSVAVSTLNLEKIEEPKETSVSVSIIAHEKISKKDEEAKVIPVTESIKKAPSIFPDKIEENKDTEDKSKASCVESDKQNKVSVNVANLLEPIENEESSDDDMVHDSFDQGNQYSEASDDEEEKSEIQPDISMLKTSESKSNAEKVDLKDISLIQDAKPNTISDADQTIHLPPSISIKPVKSLVSKPESQIDDDVKTKLLNAGITLTRVTKDETTTDSHQISTEEKPKLMCIDISKLKASSAEKKTEPIIKEPKLVEPIKIDEDDVIDVPETDPLAIPDEEIVKKEEPPVKTLSLATFKLDDTDDSIDTTSSLPIPIARALRNRKIALNVEPVKKHRKENADKAALNKNLKTTRRSNEMTKAKNSSDDEGPKNIPEAPPKISKPQTARRGRGRSAGMTREVTQNTTELNDDSSITNCESSPETAKSDANTDKKSSSKDAELETTKTDINDEVPSPRPKKRVKKKSRILGLDIDPSAIIELKSDDETPTTRSSVRQSRRIAQLKIREEAMQRKMDDIVVLDDDSFKKKKKSKKDDDKEFRVDRKSKKQKATTDEDESEEEVVDEGKKKHKKKRKHQDLKKLFNMEHPWQSSSNDSSTQNEDEEEEEVEEELTEDEAVLKSDHEFSPESDLESSSEVQPLRRARTVKKESDTEDPTDEHACQKCSKADHPEWILLCDKCDCGWHCSCLRPALLVIPEGDWFCPPCQHVALIDALKTQLTEYDKKMNRLEMEVRRKERLAYVGISLNNVLPTMKEHEPPKEKERRQHEQHSNESESSSESDESNSESSSDEDSEPIYQLRQRRQAQTYRFNDYDELINSAIQDEIEAVKGAGNQGRGKDIATIVNAEKEEAKALLEQQQQQQHEQQPLAQQQQQQQQLLQQPDQEHQTLEQSTAVELPPPVVPVIKEKEEHESEDDSEDELRVVPKHTGKKKHRKLNALDVSSGDDNADDEDFKGTSDEEEEELEDLPSEDSEDMEIGRRGKGRHGPIRRSTRARTQRYDRDFINDDSDAEDVSRRKKKRSIWDESESEESDKDWGRKKRSKKQRHSSATRTIKKSRKRKRRRDDSDPEADVKRSFKKSRIKYGGLSDSDDELLTRRTRGKKINYIDALGSDSDDEKQKSKRIIESEDEYVANEDEEEEPEQDEPLLDDDKDESDSEEDNNPNKPVKAPKGRGKAGIHRIIKASATQIPSAFIKKIEVESSESISKLPSSISENIPVIAANPENLNEEEVETMMMESEEYANKQLELMAIQLAKEKQKRVLDNQSNIQMLNKPEQMVTEVKQPKKRGRKRKVDIEAAALAAANAAAGIPNHAQNIPSIIVNTAASNQINMPGGGGVIVDEMSRISPLKSDAEILPTVVTELQTTPSKRRGRGKGKKTLEKEAAASGVDVIPTITTPEHVKSVAVSGTIVPPANTTAPTQIETSNEGTPTISETSILAGKLGIAAPPQPFSQSQPTPSVITRMLQSQPISVQNFPPAAPNQMSQKYFPGMHDPPPRNAAPPQFSQMAAGRNRVPSPYRQPSPNITIYPGMRPGPPNSPHRLRAAGPPAIQQLFHSTHHAMDPSPSGGGPINISQAAREGSSPQMITPPVSSPMAKEGPPPPPYNRAQIPVNRFSPGENSPGPSIPSPIRHHMFPQSGAHMQQSSPPPRPPPPGGNFSPYHPPPPPNYHYGAYPPAPSLAAADDALPPTDYQGSPYPEPYNTTDGTIQSSEGSNSKPFDEEGSGEFGGLVSYFSSQREDDLDT